MSVKSAPTAPKQRLITAATGRAAQSFKSDASGSALDKALDALKSKPASPKQARSEWDMLLDPERWNPREREALKELHAELNGAAITQASAERVFARAHRLLHAIVTLRICGWLRDTPSLFPSREPLSKTARAALALITKSLAKQPKGGQ